MEKAVADMLSGIEPWQCSQISERHYEPEEVLALMREDNPHWFDTTPKEVP